MVVGEIVEERDLVIIGGGPGGYHAAIRAAQLGLKVTIIEKDDLGGVCLTKGCIPSKLFATSAVKMEELKDLKKFGIHLDGAHFDLDVLHKEKESTIDQLKKGVQGLLQSNDIECIKGSAYFLSNDRLGVEHEHSFMVYRFTSAIIATGSTREAVQAVDHIRVLDCESIYTVKEIPNHLIVYGDDYLALEVATTFRQLGSNVSILLSEGKHNFSFDSSINKELMRQLKKKGIKILKGMSLKSVNQQDDVHVQTENEKMEESTLQGSHIYLTTKTVPNTTHLGIDRLEMKRDESDHLVTDEKCQTSINGIYAVGDVTMGPSLAVKAIKQGKVAAESIAGHATEMDPFFIPTVIHTNPPMAFVGLTEEQANEQYEEVNTAEFPLGGNGFATVIGKRDGLVKVVIDAKTDLILGIHMIGHGAVELASTSALALEMVARTEDLTFMHYPHPSMNEGLLEAVEALTGKAIHLSANKQVKESVT
ncbi:dihydrolipoyl dehydrogenase [Jeotgalibacillus marinus]|uniref:Dihydrolipoyl dehydrogenase n=1 Tax=Jeotgalibacillus marinus TaxID=86667 RepID=A0ABV3Q2G1_9BACL